MSQSSDDPFIEKPDEHVIEQELFCWMPSNADRQCGPDCVAFDARFVSDQRVTSCMVLNITKSIGLSLAKSSRLQETVQRGEQIRDLSPEPPKVK
jgi:hypothetical protein